MAKPKCIQKTDERQSVLWRSSNYRAQCESGFREGFWEAHHILCNHAVEQRDVPAGIKHYVEDCLWITDWDLNNPGNLIGLPKNLQYRLTNGQVPTNRCSHQVDHNTAGGYTDECVEWLTEHVWSTLADTRVKHAVEPKNLKTLLERGTAHFKNQLALRGAREGGTMTCWQNRFTPTYKDTWYHPFSMAQVPRPRSPGRPLGKFKGVFKLIG